jgi:hypothetical protein
MEKLINEFRPQFESFYTQYSKLDKSLTTIVLAEDKWSLNQIIGHLIDSASNNHQRFVRLQLNDSIHFPEYDKDEWLDTADYDQYSYLQLFQLFYYYNQLLFYLIKSVKKDSLNSKWEIPWDNKPYITLKELMTHYIEHLKGHMDHFTERLQEVQHYLNSK